MFFLDSTTVATTDLNTTTATTTPTTIVTAAVKSNKSQITVNVFNYLYF